MPSEFSTLGHLEILEIKARGDGTPDERVGLGTFEFGCEPASGLHHSLKDFTVSQVAAQTDLRISAAGIDDMDEECPAGIMVPEFVGTQAVKGGEITAIEQKVDGG